MSNDPETRYLLVTLPNTYGEESDFLVEALERKVRHWGFFDATVEHLTPDPTPAERIVAAARQTLDNDDRRHADWRAQQSIDDYYTKEA